MVKFVFWSLNSKHHVLVSGLHDLDCSAKVPQGQMLRALTPILIYTTGLSALPEHSQPPSIHLCWAQFALCSALRKASAKANTGTELSRRQEATR